MVVYRYDHWYVEFADLNGIPEDEVVSVVQARFTEILGSIAIATGRTLELSVPSAIEEHGEGIQSRVIQVDHGILSIGLGSFEDNSDVPLDANRIYKQAAVDDEVAEIVRLLALDPDWLSLRRAFEIMLRAYCKGQRSLMAKKLNRLQHEVGDLYTCLSRPGHDPQRSKKHPIKEREYNLEQATKFVRQIAKQLLT